MFCHIPASMTSLLQWSVTWTFLSKAVSVAVFYHSDSVSLRSIGQALRARGSTDRPVRGSERGSGLGSKKPSAPLETARGSAVPL